MQTRTYNVYTFDELSNEAKECAVNDYIDFVLNVIDEQHPYWPAAEKAEQMRTLWFTGSYIYEMYKDDIWEALQVNGYMFTEDGKID